MRLKPLKKRVSDSLDEMETKYDTDWVVKECDWFERRLNLEPQESQELPFLSKFKPLNSRRSTNFINSRKILGIKY